MNRGSLRLRTATGCGLSLVFNAAVKPAVSLGKLGRSEGGVFMRRKQYHRLCDRATLDQAEVFPRATKVLVAPQCLFPEGFLRAISQPAELQVNPRRVERSFEPARPSVGPAGALIVVFTPANHTRWPSLSIRQRGQINLASGDGRRFPVQYEKFFVPHQNGLGKEFA